MLKIKFEYAAGGGVGCTVGTAAEALHSSTQSKSEREIKVSKRGREGCSTCVCVCGKLSNDAFSWHQQQLGRAATAWGMQQVKEARGRGRSIDTYSGVSHRKYALKKRESEREGGEGETAPNLGQCTREPQKYSKKNVF